MAATYTTNQYVLPAVYQKFLSLHLPVSLWIHTLRDVDSAQALLNHELDFALIDSNTVFNSQLEVRPIFRERFLLLTSPDSRYPAETDPAALDPANEILVTWDPDFIRWHDSSFGPGARPLLYADTLQAADFFPRTEDLWVAAPAIAAASLDRSKARVCRFTLPRNGGDTIRWFEQVLSKPRWYLTQLHRPAMLKLVTVRRSRGP